MSLSEIIADWIDGFERDFNALQSKLSISLRAAQAGILRAILADILPALKVKDGYLVGSIGSIAKANLIERVFDEFGRSDIDKILGMYANELLAISGKNAAYYNAIGFDREKVAAIAADLTMIRQIIGVNEEGKLLNDGFLYRLGRSDAVRDSLKQYVLTSIASRQSLKTFQDGIKAMVKGGKGVDGALVGYWNSYAYDAFSKVREIDNLHFKDEVGLKHFVYQGGIIKTSRAFCIKKNGKAFSEEEAKKNWPKDPDLIDKKHLSTYNPLIDRGRHNCRHFLMWISEDRYNELKARQ